MIHRVSSIVIPFVLAAGPVCAQAPPALDKLPRTTRVTDKARPDVGYVAWAGDQVTVLVVVGASCEPCMEAVPFYKRLWSLPLIDGKARRVALLTTGGVVPVMSAIEKHPEGFVPRPAASYPGDDRFKVQVLPTVIVFDGAWKQRGRWEGKLSPSQEREVIDLIGRVAKDAGR